MSKKYNYNYVKNYIENLGYILIGDTYKTTKTKITLKCSIGYLYYTIFERLLSGCSLMKFHKYNPYTLTNIKLWLSLNNKSFELISENYENADEKLKWKCLKKECRGTFLMSWNCVIVGRECPCCHGNQVSLENCLATKNPELAKEWHPSKNGDLTPYDVTYINGTKLIWWQCKNNPKHEWKALIRNRVYRSSCPYCSGKYPSDEHNLLVNNPTLSEEWDYEKNEHTPEKYTPNSGKYAWWICNVCGHEWKARIADRNGNDRGCLECNNSKGENKISEIFKQKSLTYEIQKQFEGLVGTGGGNLSYDFYLPDYNILIEYNGEFHDGNGNYYIKQNLEKQQEHDRRKREYVKNNNIDLLEIWYYDFDNIETILETELKRKTCNLSKPINCVI